MSQHALEGCNEGSGLWLPLTEYSVRSGVSLSTIRRKIKSNSIPFRLEKGRYLILLQDHEESRESAEPIFVEAAAEPRIEPVRTRPALKPIAEPQDEAKMMSEAYELALHEKDQRIKELEDRVTELQLLVRVLEEKYEVRY